jgi:hypothetical protein
MSYFRRLDRSRSVCPDGLLAWGLKPSSTWKGDTPMGHLVLLGDSVFDNAAYVGGGPDVVAQLRARLPTGW